MQHKPALRGVLHPQAAEGYELAKEQQAVITVTQRPQQPRRISSKADINFGFYISIAFLLAGLVCSARLVNNDHYPIEVYLGLFLGIIAQLIAY